jgi:tetratricopeptide (TPR) repeat protein
MTDDLSKIKSFNSDSYHTSSCLSLEQLIAYVENRLSSQERSRIEKHLKDCKLCSDAVEGVNLTSDKGKAGFIVKSLEKEIHNRLSSGRVKKYNLIKYYSIAAILLIAVLSSLYLFNKKSPSEEIFAEYFKPYPNTIPLLRGNKAIAELQEAMMEYEHENYDPALKILQKILDAKPEFMVAHFYSGISNLCLDKPQQAIIHFKIVIEDRNNDFKEQAEWYLGLAFIKNNDIKSSKLSFQEIINKDGIYKEKSVQILNNVVFK